MMYRPRTPVQKRTDALQGAIKVKAAAKIMQMAAYGNKQRHFLDQ